MFVSHPMFIFFLRENACKGYGYFLSNHLLAVMCHARGTGALTPFYGQAKQQTAKTDQSVGYICLCWPFTCPLNDVHAVKS